MERGIRFESSVILDGYQTVVTRIINPQVFESSVILDGYQTQTNTATSVNRLRVV